MKDDNKEFDGICKKHKMTQDEQFEFSDYIHDLKDQGYKGSGKNGDFTYHELDEHAEDFMDDRRKP